MNTRLVLNLGARFDFYPAFTVQATSSRPAEIVNLESPTDLRKMDFGAPRAQDKIYNPDWRNIGPRAGFARRRRPLCPQGFQSGGVDGTAGRGFQLLDRPHAPARGQP